METKFSVMRAFGSEQFSTTVTLDKVANHEEVKQAIESLNVSLSEAFDSVLKREDKEKEKLLLASFGREQKHSALQEQLKNEQRAATELKKVEEKNRKGK